MRVKREKVIIVLFILIVTISGCNSDSMTDSDIRTEIVMHIDKCHNGDAKFFDDKIITSVNGRLTLYNLEGDLLHSYESIESNWCDSIPEDKIIVYGNFNKQIGIARLDENYNLLSNEIILQNDNLQIDPTITKVNNKYYITVTEIDGAVNNSDKEKENGVYTIHLYESGDLVNWSLISDIVSQKHNLEDVDIFYNNDKFYVIYEREEVDKGNSSVCIIKSKNSTGSVWEEPKELLKADCDHEPAVIEKMSDGGYKLYYSCDKENVGESYMGANIYYAMFDKEFNLINQDIKVKTTTDKGILLYDVKQIAGKEKFLFAKNYLSDCDLVIEEK